MIPRRAKHSSRSTIQHGRLVLSEAALENVPWQAFLEGACVRTEVRDVLPSHRRDRG